MCGRQKGGRGKSNWLPLPQGNNLGNQDLRRSGASLLPGQRGLRDPHPLAAAFPPHTRRLVRATLTPGLETGHQRWEQGRRLVPRAQGPAQLDPVGEGPALGSCGVQASRANSTQLCRPTDSCQGPLTQNLELSHLAPACASQQDLTQDPGRWLSNLALNKQN